MFIIKVYKVYPDVVTYIHYIFYFQHSCKKITRTTLCWEDGKATTALTAALKKRKKINTKLIITVSVSGRPSGMDVSQTNYTSSNLFSAIVI